ncbi:MAG: BatD family protein [Gammaproteobacteria bacterium]|nr:BatD family protein [Gammaproteobacteria bacterium]
MANANSRLALLLLLLFSLQANSSYAQAVEVSVDRTEVARDEVVTLTIRVDQQGQSMQLDLTPLAEEFEVLGTRTSSGIRTVNGVVEAWTDYIVTISPLEAGTLTIPSLLINNQQTESISIEVASGNSQPQNQNNDDLFLKIEVNKESVFVQEELQLSLKLYYTISGIRNPQFTELDMPDTVIQLIEQPNQYEELINGIRFGVYEKRYIIFPQRSGPLKIPDIRFRGEISEDGPSNFVFRSVKTRGVFAYIEGLTIDVKEVPVAGLGH